jgi:repressor LexA
MTAVTDKQKDVYDFILSYRSDLGTLPSKRDIQREFGYKSYNSAKEHVDALIRKGLLIEVKNNVGYNVA